MRFFSGGCSVRFVVFLAALSLTGCTSYVNLPAGTVRPICATAVIEKQSISVPVQELDEPPPDDYIIGPNDILKIEFPGKKTETAAASADPVHGKRVDGSGHVYLPFAGKVKAGGLTTGQLREKLLELLKPYIKDPSVTVEVAKPNSQPLYLLGQFRKPGIQYMDRPVNLIQGLALGDGPDPGANLRSARLLRNKKLVPVDIYEALVNGDLRHNIWLKGGDTIYLPDSKNQNVFVFGAVKTQGAVSMINGQLSLAQALTYGGLGEFSFDPKIRVIRSLSTTKGELYVVDFNMIMNGEAQPFMLAEGDIIYVPRSPIGNWNLALNEILPTLQAIGAVLNPFVQLKFLFDVK